MVSKGVLLRLCRLDHVSTRLDLRFALPPDLHAGLRRPGIGLGKCFSCFLKSLLHLRSQELLIASNPWAASQLQCRKPEHCPACKAHWMQPAEDAKVYVKRWGVLATLNTLVGCSGLLAAGDESHTG